MKHNVFNKKIILNNQADHDIEDDEVKFEVRLISYIYNSLIVFQHFQNLDLSKLNFERIITKTETAMQKIDIENVIKKNKRKVRLLINSSTRNKRCLFFNFKVIFPVIVLFFVIIITYSFSFTSERKR